MQSTTTAENKVLLRARVKERLARLTPEELRAGDEAMFAAFLALRETELAETVFLFWGMEREPDTSRLARALLRMGKRVVLPRCLPRHGMEARVFRPDLPLVRHPYGMLEPSPDCPLVPSEQISLALVPALCYDRKGQRLGFGGGYYDRWLAGYGGYSVGLCRDEVLQDRLPVQAHDRPVDLVLTPSARFSTK